MAQPTPYDALRLFSSDSSCDLSGENQRADGWCEGDSVLDDLRTASTPNAGQISYDWFGRDSGTVAGLDERMLFYFYDCERLAYMDCRTASSSKS